VSEDHQWRQLGSIVNAVLMDTRAKAIRKGTVSAPLRTFPRKTATIRSALAENRLGNGFLGTDGAATRVPVQLELPFGITSTSRAEFGAPRGPRSIRLT